METTLINGQVIETETKQRHSKTKRGMNQMILTDIYRTIHPKRKEYSFFSAPHGAFSKINHIIGHKTTVNRCKKIEIIPCILSDYHGVRLVFNNSKNYIKPEYT
jgi:exonuclease III